MARHADIVLPATMTLERNDIGGSPNDACLIAMHQAVAPYGEARTTTRSSPTSRRRSASATRFTEGRDEMAWLRHLYEGWREKVAHRGGLGCRRSTSSGRPASSRWPTPTTTWSC